MIPVRRAFLAHQVFAHVEPAKRAMTVALQLAPHDRHVLRSAARLYFHIRDPQRAYSLIRRNEAAPYDPWLMATELALAMSIDKAPAFLKPGIALLESGSVMPHQITELAGAAASTYLTGAGPHRRSRKLFAQSLADPNDNRSPRLNGPPKPRLNAFWKRNNCDISRSPRKLRPCLPLAKAA